MNTRQLGIRAETLVFDFLVSANLTIHAQNYRCPIGEIDIIAQHHDVLIFIEVKSRKDNDAIAAAERVNPLKQHKIILTAQDYLLKNKLNRIQCRFDVICVTQANSINPKIHWIKNAFEANV